MQVPKIDDFYNMNYEKGEIHLRGVKGRAFVLPTQAWAALRVLLSKSFKDDAAPFMLQMGYAVGISFVMQVKKLEGKPGKLIRILLSIAKSSGWGHFSVEGDADNGTELTVFARNCPFCHNESSTQLPVCYFLVGFVNGLIDYLYGKRHKASETECRGMGQGACVVTVKEIPVEIEGRNCQEP